MDLWGLDMASTFDLITSHTFGAGSSEVEFTSISQSYQHLYVYLTGAATAAASTQVEVQMIPNQGDWTGSPMNTAIGRTGNVDASGGIRNYQQTASSDFSLLTSRLPGANSLWWGSIKCMFYDYSVAGKNKAWKVWSNGLTDYTYVDVGGGAGSIAETPAIDKIKFKLNSVDFVSGTMIRIYGLANS